MADNRKYYYLKLKENFFDSDSIVLLEDMKDGILYSNILLKLYLKTLKNGGRLQLDEHIPYTAQMIATLTRHQIGTVERALAIFQQLGLVEQLDCGLLYPDMGYRRIRDELDGHKGIHVNDKRVLRICRKYDIKSNIKWKPKSCTRGDRNPDHIAKNYLHREFHAEKPNEKWLTDVSEFKYYNGIEVHKVYLSAILDLYDRRIVSFKISDHNDNPLVMDTFDEAIRQEPDAHPLVHSDRGFQYTSAQFYTRLKKHHMKQSMSRVAHCIDNGPMEGFWGILKREMYYKQRFNDRSSLITAIANYIDYYNNQRLQRKLHVMTPMKYHEQYTKAA